MRGAPLRGLDLSVYAAALPRLVRTPALVVVPLLTLVVGVFLRQVIAGLGGGVGGELALGLAQFVALLLALYGLGSACILADASWRGRPSFDAAWSETQRRGGEVLSAAVGFALLVSVGQYISQMFGVLGIVLTALIVFFLIWSVPAAAIGGVPGGAAIQVSIDRVRANPLAAGIATTVTLLLVFYAAPALTAALVPLLGPAIFTSTIAIELILALLQAVAIAYCALILSKTYADAAFARRW